MPRARLSRKSSAQLDREIAEALAHPAHATKQTAVPFHQDRCYACDSKAVGVRDRRPEGGMIEPGCKRHADPSIKSYAACMYCSGPGPTRTIDGDFVHKGCHDEASK